MSNLERRVADLEEHQAPADVRPAWQLSDDDLAAIVRPGAKAAELSDDDLAAVAAILTKGKG